MTKNVPHYQLDSYIYIKFSYLGKGQKCSWNYSILIYFLLNWSFTDLKKRSCSQTSIAQGQNCILTSCWVKVIMVEVIREDRFRCEILSNTIKWGQLEGHRVDVGQLYDHKRIIWPLWRTLMTCFEIFVITYYQTLMKELVQTERCNRISINWQR